MANTSSKSEVDRRVGAAYLSDFAPAVVGYALAIFAVTLLIDFDPTAWWEIGLALTPVIPALWGVRSVARHLGRIDEMQREIHLSAMAFGFGVAMVVTLTVGFLGLAGLDTKQWGSWVIYIAGTTAWSVVAACRGAPV